MSSDVLQEMILNRKVSLRTVCVTLIITVPLMILGAMSLNPQYRRGIEVRKYLDEVEPKWQEMISIHPEFKEAEFIVSSQPSILLKSRIDSGSNLAALKDFFRRHRPPETVRMTIWMDLEDAGVQVDRYVARFPEDPDGGFIVGEEMPAAPSDRNHKAEQAAPEQPLPAAQFR